MFSVFRHALIATLLVVVFAVSGCGNSDEDVDRAREEGAREARLQEKQKQQRERQKQLEDKIKELEKNQARAGSGGESAPSSSSGSAGRTSCGDGLSVGPNTTCAFARVVRAEYQRTGNSTIEAYSPVTARTYVMTCSSGSPHVCVGGNNASVYFP